MKKVFINSVIHNISNMCMRMYMCRIHLDFCGHFFDGFSILKANCNFA